MNERIKELALLSGFDIDTNVSFAEKTRLKCFAELIVKECVAICEDTDGEHIADVRWGRRCCALEIKEHFGVEE
jgi:hypothetical protein